MSALTELFAEDIIDYFKSITRYNSIGAFVLSSVDMGYCTGSRGPNVLRPMRMLTKMSSDSIVSRGDPNYFLLDCFVQTTCTSLHRSDALSRKFHASKHHKDVFIYSITIIFIIQCLTLTVCMTDLKYLNA